MTRRPGDASKDLRVRAFGTAGRKAGAEILRCPVSPPAKRAGRRGLGRIYNFPLRRTPEEK
jgi:hypothetical protein